MGNQNRQLYIVISQTGTLLSRILKQITGAEYNHASISLSRDLERMYSFGRRHPYNPFWGGFVIESPPYRYLQAFFRNQGVGSERECHRRTTRRAQRNARCDVEAEEEVQLQLYWLMSGILPCCLEAGGLLLLLRVCRRASHKKSG